MMTKPIIEINRIGKMYRIGHREKYLSLRDEIAGLFSPKARKVHALKKEYWALKDVTFSVNQGDAVGIIGKNGAGKSTLLKVLSKITPPTEGCIIKRGRVASLLEVGTGFHPELTGKENIYLNGTVLGMTRREVQRKFDEIVAFSEIEKFLETPVKRYSSGMYVRLAFAVAAHLEPEILVVDEVLAVGDINFQRKCLGKMDDVAKSGRTVLFVSHNMSAVSQLCNRCIVLSAGNVSYDGDVETALARYTQGSLCDGAEVSLIDDDRLLNKKAVISKVSLTDKSEELCDSFFVGEPMTVNFLVEFFTDLAEFQLSFMVQSSYGGAIYHCVSRDAKVGFFKNAKAGDQVLISATFPTNKLYPGRYIIDDVWLADSRGDMLDYVDNCIAFNVPDTTPHVNRPLPTSKAIIHEVPEWKLLK